MIVETRVDDSGLYVCHVTSQLLDKSVLSKPIQLDVQGKLFIQLYYRQLIWSRTVACMTAITGGLDRITAV